MHSPSKVAAHPKFERLISALFKTTVVMTFFLFLDCSSAQAQEPDIIKQLKAEANSGDYSAAHVLATAYAVGDGVTKDRQESDHWYSVAASIRDKRTTIQADTKLATTINDSSVKENKFLFLPEQNTDKVKPVGQFSFGSVNSRNVISVDSTPTSKQTTSETSVVTKTKEFLSEHTDEIEELATFLFEKYVTGGESSEGTTKNSGESAKPSK